jgi:hypothetical protein
MEIDVAGALRDLGLVADRLAALLEWEKLAQQERGSRKLPPFSFRDHNRNDIIDLYGHFLSLSSSLHAILDSTDGTFVDEERHTWWRQLRKLEDRVQCFGIMDNYIKP